MLLHKMMLFHSQLFLLSCKSSILEIFLSVKSGCKIMWKKITQPAFYHESYFLWYRLSFGWMFLSVANWLIQFSSLPSKLRKRKKEKFKTFFFTSCAHDPTWRKLKSSLIKEWILKLSLQRGVAGFKPSEEKACETQCKQFLNRKQCSYYEILRSYWITY